MTIQRLTPDHAAEYRSLMLQAYTERDDAFTSTPAERAALPLTWWQARLSPAPDADQVVLGAWRDGALVGVCGVSFETRPKVQHKATLFGMYVAPQARQSGLGGQLVQAALTLARQRPGVRLMQLTVTQGNAPAEALYARHGFVAYGVEPMAVAVAAGFVAKVEMWCDLSDADADMKAYYANRAPYYDAVYAKPERQADIAFLCQHLPQRFEGLEVLEVACGTGYWTQHLAPRARRYLATDALPEPMALARQRPGVERAQFSLADAYALGPSLGSFNAGFAGLWFSHVPVQRRQEFLRGWHARLRPGARVVLLENSKVQCLEHPLVYTDEHGNTFQQRPLRDGSSHRVLKNFPTQAELEAMLQPLGGRPTDYRELDNFWLFEYEV